MVKILAFFVGLMLGLNAHAQDAVFLTHNVENATFFDKNQYLRGIPHAGRRAFSVEVVHELRKRLDLLGPTRTVPFKRGFELVKSDEQVVFFNVNRTPEREKMVQWVGPLLRSESFFVDSKDRPTFVTSLEDVKQLSSVCVVLGNIHDEKLTELGLANLLRMNSYEGCAKMIKSGRADITILATDSMLFAMEDYKDVLNKTPLPYLQGVSYLTLSSAFGAQDVQKWQRVFDEMLTDGTYQRLYEEYFE